MDISRWLHTSTKVSRSHSPSITSSHAPQTLVNSALRLKSSFWTKMASSRVSTRVRFGSHSILDIDLRDFQSGLNGREKVEADGRWKKCSVLRNSSPRNSFSSLSGFWARNANSPTPSVSKSMHGPTSKPHPRLVSPDIPVVRSQHPLFRNTPPMWMVCSRLETVDVVNRSSCGASSTLKS